jgi:5'-methylthioadenosine phosphorylase
MLGIIGGTSLQFVKLPQHLTPETVDTPYGPVQVRIGSCVLLQRHQGGRAPHRINFRAQMAALALREVDRVIAIGSAGSLHTEIPPGTLLIPHDYMSWAPIPSIHDHAIAHACPEIDPRLAAALARIVPDARSRGVYVQTPGPRIETKAEVQALSSIADVVGMTLASEATVAKELGIPFAALCSIDNYAHGLDGEVLTFDHILAASRSQSARMETIIAQIIGELA